MYYPISPVPLPVYPSGIQGAVLVVNPNDTYITVSDSSSPLSGVGVAPRGNLTWPANTPLWVYGPLGAFVDVGGAPTSYNGDISAQFAYALANTTVNTNTNVSVINPGTDEDDLRAYNQSQIDALTANDKTTNFLIYNTSTGKLNYVVNGAVIVPTSTLDQKAQGTYTGNATSQRAIAVGFTPDLVMISASQNNVFVGWLHRTETANIYQSASIIGATAGAVTDAIISNGFQVGVGVMNSNNITYYWTAFKFATA